MAAKNVEIFSREAKGAIFSGPVPHFSEKNIFKPTSSTDSNRGYDSVVSYIQLSTIFA